LFVVATTLASRADDKADQQAQVERELLRLEHEWSEAMPRSDKEYLNRILSDDYFCIHQDGTVGSKADELKDLESGKYEIKSLKLEQMRVRLYAQTAVVTGRTTLRSTYQGENHSGQFRWTDVWVRRHEKWQCVSSQMTRVLGADKAGRHE